MVHHLLHFGMFQQSSWDNDLTLHLKQAVKHVKSELIILSVFLHLILLSFNAKTSKVTCQVFWGSNMIDALEEEPNHPKWPYAKQLNKTNKPQKSKLSKWCESLFKFLKAQNKRVWTSPAFDLVCQIVVTCDLNPGFSENWLFYSTEVMKRSLTDSEHFSSRSPRTRRPYKTHKHTGAAGMECFKHIVQEGWAVSQTEMIRMMAKLNNIGGWPRDFTHTLTHFNVPRQSLWISINIMVSYCSGHKIHIRSFIFWTVKSF